MPSIKNHCNNEAGLSFIEFLVSIVLVGIIAGALFNLVQTGLSTWRFGEIKMDLMGKTRRAMEHMSRELRQGGSETVIITSVDQYSDIIEFDADIEFGVSEPDDLEHIEYELLSNGDVQKTITDSDLSVQSFIIANNIVEMHFNPEEYGVVAIRMRGQRDELIVDLATKVWPRNI
ncbi:MAG: prepilin-type N-terminal cleavage/methylation domain-containing protein [bacterium]